LARLRSFSLSITAAAYEAVAASLPFGSVGFEGEPNAKGERMIWLDETFASLAKLLDALAAMRARPWRRRLVG